MTDDELEQVLRRVRPAGPPPELRARIIAARPERPAWPWAMAAAALLVLTLTLHGFSNRTLATAIPAADDTLETVAGLTQLLGGGEDARAAAEMMIAADQIRDSVDSPGSSPESRP